MELIKTATAGAVATGDVLVTLAPNPDGGLELSLHSTVLSRFGQSIEATVRAVLLEFNVTNAKVSVEDKGALDCVLRARVQTAVCRAAEHHFDWQKEA